MPPLRIPHHLQSRVGAGPGDVRQDWIDDLPRVVAELSGRWALRVGPPFEPGGRSSWTAPAWDSRGRPCVLKLGFPHDEAEHEAVALTAWAGDGAVRLHATGTVGRTTALLLERCRPGTPLGSTVPEGEQDEIIAGLLLRLWAAPVGGTGLRPLEHMCDQWASEFEAAGPARPPAAADPGLDRLALQMFRDLPRTAARRVLLSTDLHAGNVLSARRETWLATDPKPFVGDPTYDVLQHMLNCPRRLSLDPAGLPRRMADLLGLDSARVMHWLFARAVLDCTGRPWLSEVARRLAP